MNRAGNLGLLLLGVGMLASAVARLLEYRDARARWVSHRAYWDFWDDELRETEEARDRTEA